MSTERKKLLITNLVYGPVYSRIFLEHHLTSLLDETNIPTHKERIEYHVFTDDDTLPILDAHPNFRRLKDTIPLSVSRIEWQNKGTNEAKFDQRYTLLQRSFRSSVGEALERGTYLSAIVADLVFAKGYVGKVLARLDEGYDSVFVLPLRSAYEAMRGPLSSVGEALEPGALFRLGYENLHPLWVASHWDSPQFTKLPFTLLWNSGTGLLARSFSITPIAFTPTKQMDRDGIIVDVQVPGMCKNPYWAEDWTEAPVIGVEPLFCYYPPFTNRPSTAKEVREWAEELLDSTQIPFLRKCLYYPDRKTVDIGRNRIWHSDTAVTAIIGEAEETLAGVGL